MVAFFDNGKNLRAESSELNVCGNEWKFIAVLLSDSSRRNEQRLWHHVPIISFIASRATKKTPRQFFSSLSFVEQRREQLIIVLRWKGKRRRLLVGIRENMENSHMHHILIINHTNFGTESHSKEMRYAQKWEGEKGKRRLSYSIKFTIFKWRAVQW